MSFEERQGLKLLIDKASRARVRRLARLDLETDQCAACGGPRENVTPGCKTCARRARNRDPGQRQYRLDWRDANKERRRQYERERYWRNKQARAENRDRVAA